MRNEFNFHWVFVEKFEGYVGPEVKGYVDYGFFPQSGRNPELAIAELRKEFDGRGFDLPKDLKLSVDFFGDEDVDIARFQLFDVVTDEDGAQHDVNVACCHVDIVEGTSTLYIWTEMSREYRAKDRQWLISSVEAAEDHYGRSASSISLKEWSDYVIDDISGDEYYRLLNKYDDPLPF